MPNQTPISSTPVPTSITIPTSGEQALITNVVLTNVASNGQAVVTVQNTGSSNYAINATTIDGNTATMNPLTQTVYAENTGTVNLTSSTAFANSAQYTIRLTNANGKTLTNQASYTGP